MPRTLQTAIATLAVGLGACCSSSDFYQQQPTGAGASTGHAAAGSGTSGGSGGTSSGSTSGGTLGCNPDPASCPGYGVSDPLNACSNGLVELVANLVEFDFQSSPQPITCPLELTDVYNPSIELQTDQCGYIHYCTPTGTQLSLSVPGGEYVAMNFATIVMTRSAQMPNRPGIPMVKSTVLNSLNQVLPGADPSQAMAIVNVQTLATTSCTDKGGWSLSLVDGKGEAVDAGLAYLIDGVPTPGVAATDISGIAFFYNMNATLLGTVSPRGTKEGNQFPDGGVLCANPETGAPLGLTGWVPLASGVISVVPFVVAPSE